MLLAFDLDGTIVTRDYTLPDRTRAAILAARDAGHIVTVITGRNRTGAQRFLDALGVDCHYGTCQGARVHAIGDEHHDERHLEGDVVEHVLDRLEREADPHFFLSTRERYYVRDPLDARWSWARAEGQQLAPLTAYAGEAAHKFVLMTPGALDLHAELAEAFPHLAYYPWHDRYLEIVAAGGTKGRALERLARVHGVAREDTVSFGDGPNDISMHEWAGHAVGVGDLAAGVESVIDEHIAAPEENGVAAWLERHVL